MVASYSRPRPWPCQLGRPPAGDREPPGVASDLADVDDEGLPGPRIVDPDGPAQGVTVVPTSWATVAIDTFITELSSVMRNCAADSVRRMMPVAGAAAAAAGAAVTVVAEPTPQTTPPRGLRGVIPTG